MRTNIEIDDALMAEATQLSGLRTKRDVVHFVLNRYVKIERQRKALEGLRGLGWDGDLEAMRTDDPVREWG
ncbi:MAG: type II toxin-antitoxin system VapB family antitoxin [Sphingomonas sp.]|jgi:Arc/MetJ family transcription regulator|uniref:type II toxin-antitoxin system VapB family antitoxin n=1 Tax=Sphingomonas sp. CD22 TaxID=3100214 RepID=UPI0012184827|nr:type II toxin-antitoxin system VapB family antitoxin [Sphingomonas sp. CD22]MEA1085641.1 type II toxin-antitoxin system VapB family antitoxin [Sphingomonas sp. CD22]RZL58715.1 MAG: type II toxin-antitoxin system VapB family antitoxin [Sphingomonas sp.]